VTEPPTRRAMQICSARGGSNWDMLYVLADDGTIWGRPAGPHTDSWEQVEPLPQPEPPTPPDAGLSDA
jgi:hypothetical protein